MLHLSLNSTQRIPFSPTTIFPYLTQIRTVFPLTSFILHKNHIIKSTATLTQLPYLSTMESVGSNPSPPNTQPLRSSHHRFRPSAQSFSDRMVRALHHHLHLLHRSDSDFYVLGATGNVYIVTLSSNPSCTCPDRATPCKHILFVFIRVLGVSLEDNCLRRRTLRACQLSRLLGLPTLSDAVAGAGVRKMFHQLYFGEAREGWRSRPTVEIEEGTACPVCLEEMDGKEERVVVCRTCRNPIHEECLLRWKRSTGRRSASCVICRARWRERTTSEQDKFLNLSAYVNESISGGGGDGLCGG